MRTKGIQSFQLFQNKLFTTTSIVFLLLTIIPFLIVSFFTNPTWDDFDFTVNALEFGFLRSQYNWYIGWSGRFFSTALMSTVNPLMFHSIIGYKLASLSVIILFIITVFYFVRSLTGNTLNLAQYSIAALSICSLYFYKMANPALGFYWLSSAVIYQLANILFLILIILLIKYSKQSSKLYRTIYLVIISFIILAIQGSNEISMLLTMEFLGILFIYHLFKYRKINYSLLFFIVISIIGFYLVYTAPGNGVRESKNPQSHMLFASLSKSLSDTIELILYRVTDTPLLLFTILAIPFIFKISESQSDAKKYFNCNPLLSVFSVFTILLSINFVTYWTINKGMLDRTRNVFYFFLLIGWFYNLLVFCNYFFKYRSVKNFKLPAAAVIIISLIIVISYGRKNNVLLAYKELNNGSLINFDDELSDRYDNIKKVDSDTCILKPLSNPVPGLMFFYDIGADPNAKHNKYQAYYYHKKIMLVSDTNKKE
ncbi:MAG: DUF6056 family protein [Ignavibacteria bacterium]